MSGQPMYLTDTVLLVKGQIAQSTLRQVFLEKLLPIGLSYKDPE